MDIRLRHTRESDLDFVLAAEQDEENRPFVKVWTREQHLAALASEDISHLIIESAGDGSVGYVILAGLSDANRSVEVRRVVVTVKGRGYGKGALRLINDLVFVKLEAHRLWLDVKEHNARARHVYESEGFVTEGVLRECLKTETGFESLVVMSILRNEYPTAGGSALEDGERRVGRAEQHVSDRGETRLKVRPATRRAEADAHGVRSFHAAGNERFRGRDGDAPAPDLRREFVAAPRLRQPQPEVEAQRVRVVLEAFEGARRD